MRLPLTLLAAMTALSAQALELTRAVIQYNPADGALAAKMAHVLADDVKRVSGVRPMVSDHNVNTKSVVLQLANEQCHPELVGQWEQYVIHSNPYYIIVTGSDPRGLAYGVLHISEQIGVSPWYWMADVPVPHQDKVKYSENYRSQEPSIRYRGVFINDEDWGLKTWSSLNYEKELGDIGPKTYDRVCELILRLHGNMLAPAMHTCTGAFYSHPESQAVADSWGIMITTSHCEPLLFNNAAPSEWNKQRDGEWNYLTNKETIQRKFHDRISSTAQYHNIYTMGMRGLHDEAMKGSEDPTVRARTLEQVFADQRQILEQYKQQPASTIPQIFVPYKETLDIYDAGLRVPDDITLVWPDDNYGYMKRISNATERQRQGGSGVYYHLSYLGTPHDNLWIATTAPVLMYEELKKAYDAGADRYWLLNVGDIKPMEIEMQQFFDMAWDFSSFDFERANTYQAEWLSRVYGKQYRKEFQSILDTYYHLAWQRKPEFMGYEFEWDSDENNRLHDTDFSFADGSAQQRLADYQHISDQCQGIYESLSEGLRPAFFEMLGYSVQSAYQMNRKFLLAQRNHETGSADDARDSRAAYDSIQSLIDRYHTQLDGKWNQMISQVPPGYTAKYHLMPELVSSPTTAYRLPEFQFYPTYANQLSLDRIKAKGDFRSITGLGTHWTALQLGEPHDAVQDPASLSSSHIDLPLKTKMEGDSITLQISVLPMWPTEQSRSNRFGVSVDGCTPVVCENIFKEWSLEWKLQVLENRKDFILRLPIDHARKHHTLSLVIGDPGQIVQAISYE